MSIVVFMIKKESLALVQDGGLSSLSVRVFRMAGANPMCRQYYGARNTNIYD